jgi:hypothetical protein
MKSWFAANIDTNKGLSGPFSFNHVPATRESGDAPTAPIGGGILFRRWGRSAYLPKILSKQSGFKKRQIDPEYPLGLE